MVSSIIRFIQHWNRYGRVVQQLSRLSDRELADVGINRCDIDRSQTQVSEIAGKSVTTIEGLSPDSSHPVQKAWLAERVPQCGYCQSGQIMSAADLLKQNPKPSREQIVEYMSTNICRCGTYQRIVRAVERAAREA
jgi:aerobic-type carbon monoxide dehydrogenase small subunit (CoxS/CutS family)